MSQGDRRFLGGWGAVLAIVPALALTLLFDTLVGSLWIRADIALATLGIDASPRLAVSTGLLAAGWLSLVLILMQRAHHGPWSEPLRSGLGDWASVGRLAAWTTVVMSLLALPESRPMTPTYVGHFGDQLGFSYLSLFDGTTYRWWWDAFQLSSLLLTILFLRRLDGRQSGIAPS